MGNQLLSFKGDGPWRGKTTRNVNDRGQRRLLKLENGYVSSDGAEIRHFPGFQTLVDLSEANNDAGYHRYVTDGVKPIYESTPGNSYKFLSYQETTRDPWYLASRAKPIHLHGFEQVGGTLVIWGESRFRESPIMDANGDQVLLSTVGVTSGRWTLTMSNSVSAIVLPFGGFAGEAAGMNGLLIGHVIYCEGITVASSALQAFVDTNLNGRVHEVKAISGAVITLHTTTAGTGSSAASAGDVHKVRPSRSDIYSTPNGVYPYTGNALGGSTLDRPDDPDALTSWRVISPLGLSVTPECFPAWVANRTRDFGDAVGASSWYDVEGVFTRDNGSRGVSRRETRSLPYRTNPECAQDRIILAAPGYGCMFQIPLQVAINPQNWPATPDDDDLGVAYHANDVFDQPRALGLPKARLIESVYTPALSSPSENPSNGYNFAAVPSALGSPEFGLPAGDYLVSIAYEDEALGEEGLASEPVEITIPSNDYAYTIGINYVHPGYIMPECLANKINVYIAGPNETAMAYYTSFQIEAYPRIFGGLQGLSYDESARYGFRPCSPSNPMAIWREFQLQLPQDAISVTDAVDPERLAPQSASMPRGSEACRYIRGVLLAGGSTGNTGGSLELWAGIGSTLYDNLTYNDRAGMHIIARNEENAMVPYGGEDGSANDGTLGTAGRYFPDAYQGIEVFAPDLFPTGSLNQQVDRVVNPRTGNPSVDVYQHHDFLSLTRNIWGNIRFAGSPLGITNQSRINRQVWYRMPKGQLQVGDPGAPNRSSKAAIQFIDPNRGDDITAIGNLSGTAIICSRRETYSMAWYRVPGGEVPQLISNEHGCIAANSMVEFDGGVAWIGEKGPVAMGATLQFIGDDVKEDFAGVGQRYVADTRGMMRHTWGCHDSVRGLVMWGLVTKDSTVTVDVDDITYGVDSFTNGALSRFPCDEVLIWSYRANAFSTWRPPAGLEILWMREIRDVAGRNVVAFLARDGRIYQLDDASNDISTYLVPGQTGISDLEFAATTAGDESTTVTLSVSSPGIDGAAVTGRSVGIHFAVGKLVELLDEDGVIIGETTIASIGTLTASTIQITLAASFSWAVGAIFRVGARQRMTIIGTYLGGETMDSMSVQGMQMRYTLYGTGKAHAKGTFLKTDIADLSNTTAKIVAATAGGWKLIGDSEASLQDDPLYRIGRRIQLNEGGVDAPEVTVKVEISGASQTRICDLALEVG